MHPAFAAAAPLRNGTLHHRAVDRRRTVRPASMVLDKVDKVSTADDARNARLGIDNLWSEPFPPKLKEQALTDADELASLPIVGTLSPASQGVLPWDTTTGAQSISFLQRRLTYSRRRQRVLSQSYEECRRITALFSKTFYVGCGLLSPSKRRAVWAIYTWCRRTDDLVDGPRVAQRTAGLRGVLADWGARLDGVFRDGAARDSLDLALVDVVQSFPYMTPRPFHDMIAGMRMDVDQAEFDSFDELYLYCYRVAGTVGLITLPIIGAAAPGREGLQAAADAAVALGIALQLTNILRDVGEDRLRGRIYLPLEDLRRFKYSREDLFAGVCDQRYEDLMKFQIERARRYFRKAEMGVPLLAEDARLPVQASLDMYSQILDVLEENDYDNFHKRAYLSKMGKALTVPQSWVRIQEAPHWKLLSKYLDKFTGRKISSKNV